MRKIFVKFNDSRRKEFNVSTTIVAVENEKYVVKEAVNESAKAHLDTIYNNYELMKLRYPVSQICPCRMQDGKIFFDYIEGDLLFNKYLDAVQARNKKVFLDLVDLHKQLLLGNKENECVFEATDEFKKMFGESSYYENKKAIMITNFEATANNIIITEENRPIFIDYEWVMNYPMPVDFVIYQGILTLYNKIEDLEEFIPCSELQRYLHIETDLGILEGTFNYLYNYLTEYNGSYSNDKIKYKYLKNSVDIKELINADPTTISKQKEVVQSLNWHVNKVKELEKAIEYHQANDRYLEEQKQELDKQLAWYHQRVEELEKAIEYHQANDRYLEGEKQELDRQLAWYNQRVEELEKAIEYHQANDRYLENEKKQLEKQVKWYEGRVGQLETAINYHNKNEELLNEKISYQQAESIELRNQLENEKQLIATLRRQIFEMENSLSWKITKFLRR